MRRCLLPLTTLLLAACSRGPDHQTVRIEPDPADATCQLRQGAVTLPLTGNTADVTSSDATLVVTCSKPGYRTATARKFPMSYTPNPMAGPLLLMLDSDSTRQNTYPPVIRLKLEAAFPG